MNNKVTRKTAIKINTNTIMEYFEDGGVVYVDAAESFYAVDRFGAEILKYIEANDSFIIENMVEYFYQKYAVSKMELENDLLLFIIKLVEIGAVIIEE